MAPESTSDFSIVKNYIELKSKYDTEIKQASGKFKEMEDKYKSHIATLEQEIKKRNEHIKAYDQKVQDLNKTIAEKEEQLKNLGLQLHRLKSAGAAAAPQAQPATEEQKKKGFFK